MRIFLDCTHTAVHPYKNTGIHRLVRQFSGSFQTLSAKSKDIEVYVVMFDGAKLCPVTSLTVSDADDGEALTVDHSRFHYYLRKVKEKTCRIVRKLKGKWLSFRRKVGLERPEKLKFGGQVLSSGDIYLIADANWDQPASYYNFLAELRGQGVSLALICYDLIPIKFPQFCSQAFSDVFSAFLCGYAPLFDKILCISQRTADDFLAAREQGLLPMVPGQQVLSFHLGSNFLDDGQYEAVAKDSPVWAFTDKQYVLSVGSLAPHKNVKATVAAFDALCDRYPDFHVVFAGNRGWHPDTDELIMANSLYGSRLHILCGLSDSEVRVLYQHCYCLVQASFYEGYGLPVVEALSMNRPVIASNGGSLPEVGGEFCLYFDPYFPDQLAEQLDKLLGSSDFYDFLVDKLRDHYRPLSWQESAQQALDLLLLEVVNISDFLAEV
jgi:alpha-1,2-rhamnosyltransferase